MWKKRPKILQMRNFGWKFGVFFSVSGRDWLQCCHPLGTFQCPGAGRGRQQIWHDDEWWWMMIPNPNSWSVYVYLYIDTQDRYSSWSVVQGNCLPKAEEFPDFFGGWSQRRVSNHSLKFLKTTPTWKFEDGKSTEKKEKNTDSSPGYDYFQFQWCEFWVKWGHPQVSYWQEISESSWRMVKLLREVITRSIQ